MPPLTTLLAYCIDPRKVIEEMATHLLDRYGEERCKMFMFEVVTLANTVVN
jgi:hypothetical protein